MKLIFPLSLLAFLYLGVEIPVPEETEDTAIQRIEQLGGTVTRDLKRAGHPVVGVNL